MQSLDFSRTQYFIAKIQDVAVDREEMIAVPDTAPPKAAKLDEVRSKNIHCYGV